MGFTNVFGANPVKPANPTYEPLTLSANQALLWPLETMDGVPYVAAQIDVTATAGGFLLEMPPANQGSTGIASFISNVGAHTFTLTDTGGNQICQIQAGETWILSLTDNSTANGVWRAYQLGATTSNANAGQLADNETLQANGSQLRVFAPPSYHSADYQLLATDRGSVAIWQGNTGNFTFDTAANLANGWYCFVSNQGSGALTLQATDGSLIDGDATAVLQPGTSLMVTCANTGAGHSFNLIGNIDVPISVASGGTGANNPTGALVNLGGSALGISIFGAANAAAVLALLGISQSTLTESTINSNQALGAGSTQTAFVVNANGTACSFTGAIAANVLTVSAVASGSLAAGQTVFGASVASGTTILNQIGGTPGGAGTYNISPNQTVGSEAMTSTAGVVLTLPLTTGLTKQYFFAVYAKGTAVTLTPNVADAINGGTAGASYTLTQGTSGLFITDANHNWWPFYVSNASGSVASVGLQDSSGSPLFVVTGSPVTNSGTLTMTLATQAKNKIFAGPASGADAQPTFRVQVIADLPTNLGFGQCRLGYTNATHITLACYNGNLVIINGVLYQLPAAGVAAANTGVMVNGAGASNLAVSTSYYVSLYNNAGTPTLAYWALGAFTHVPDTTAGNVGVEIIKTVAGGALHSDHTLVGMVRANVSAQFFFTASDEGVISWFNKQSKSVFVASGGTTASVTFVPVSAVGSFLSWAGDLVQAGTEGGFTNVSGGDGAGAAGFFVDGTNYILSPATLHAGWGASAGATAALSFGPDGYHTFYGAGEGDGTNPMAFGIGNNVTYQG